MTIRVSKDRIDMDDKILRKPVIQDYGETCVTANSSTAYTVDLTTGNVFNITLTGNCTFTFSNPPASGTAGSFTLILTQDATGSRTVVWPSAVIWRDAETPLINSKASKVSVLEFATTDAGTTWYGLLSGCTTSSAGQELFTASGSFVVPLGVHSISAVCVGGGGEGSSSSSAGGGGSGGDLRYVTSLPVVPGETLTVTVGAGGSGGSTTGGDGGYSSIAAGDTTLLLAAGGGGGTEAAPRSQNGTSSTVAGNFGGANGGAGATASGSTAAGGGGGAGGYSAAGGAGSFSTTGASSTGGGGGGGGAGGSASVAGAGGGVGVLGAGSNGAGGANGSPGTRGGGGSSGTGGTATSAGGDYGGGGGGDDNGSGAGNGGAGAVRIIWGSGRAYPSTSTADV